MTWYGTLIYVILRRLFVFVSYWLLKSRKLKTITRPYFLNKCFNTQKESPWKLHIRWWFDQKTHIDRIDRQLGGGWGAGRVNTMMNALSRRQLGRAQTFKLRCSTNEQNRLSLYVSSKHRLRDLCSQNNASCQLVPRISNEFIFSLSC